MFLHIGILFELSVRWFYKSFKSEFSLFFTVVFYFYSSHLPSPSTTTKTTKITKQQQNTPKATKSTTKHIKSNKINNNKNLNQQKNIMAINCGHFPSDRAWPPSVIHIMRTVWSIKTNTWGTPTTLHHPCLFLSLFSSTSLPAPPWWSAGEADCRSMVMMMVMMIIRRGWLQMVMMIYI